MKYILSIFFIGMGTLFFNTIGMCEICSDCKDLYNACLEQECGTFFGKKKKHCIKKSNCQFDPTYTDCKKNFCAEDEDESADEGKGTPLLPP